MSLSFAALSESTIPLHVISPDGLDDWLGGQDASVVGWVATNGFTGAIGQTLLVPSDQGKASMALAGYGTPDQRARKRYILASAVKSLPVGTYNIASGLPEEDAQRETLGWLLSAYQFNRYHGQSKECARLVAPAGIDATRIEIIAEGEALTRDLINTPASDMGPDALETAVQHLAENHGASCTSITGQDLLTRNFPMIHAVGRASATAPRLVDMRWGSSGPRLTLVGKGVCFDTGGLNLKTSTSMGLMKKDMGGAATILGLAHMIMALKLPLQLRVLIPAVENSVSANSFRPQDILTSRKGLTVEINNTDAEGRLVLADALALADEEQPDLILSMATLTGAARVAVGPDLAPFYVDADTLAQSLEIAAKRVADPVWRMPFHTPYETLIEPGIADLDNAPSGGFAGSITAALFLRRFVTASRYMHFDIYGWQPTTAPARPKGGTGQGARAVLEALPDLLNL